MASLVKPIFFGPENPYIDLLQADTTGSVARVQQAVTNLFMRGYSLPAIEEVLRTYNCHSYLIAHCGTDHLPMSIPEQSRGSSEETCYYLGISIGDKGIFKESCSYDENFIKLRRTYTIMHGPSCYSFTGPIVLNGPVMFI
jgi:hypothetical protein